MPLNANAKNTTKADPKWKVELLQCELTLFAQYGIQRRASQVYDPDRGAQEDHNWDQEIEGALAEAAVAKRLNLFNCSAVDAAKGSADVGQFQVRSTRHPGGGLIIRPKDITQRRVDGDGKWHNERRPTNTIYIAVTGQDGMYHLRGWSRDIDVCVEDYYNEGKGKPFWLMPQDDLDPMGTLVRHLKRR